MANDPIGPNQIGNFKSKFDGGTRPNRFVISGSTPEGDIDSLMIKSGSMPAQSVGIIQMPFRGRVAKLPGDRIYSEWTFTVIDDAEGATRSKFRKWHAAFNKHKANTMDPKIIDQMKGQQAGDGEKTFFQEWTVTQLDMTGLEIPNRTIALINCWPVEVGAIELSYDVADTVTEFSITLAYDYIKLKEKTGTT